MTTKSSDIVASVAARAGVTKTDAAAAVNAVFSFIAESLAGGEDVRIGGFGTFKRVERAERMARNPRTGEKVRVPARRVAVFKPASDLEGRL